MVSSLPVSDQKIDRSVWEDGGDQSFLLCESCFFLGESRKHLWKNEKSHFWHPGLSVHEDDENLAKGNDEATTEKEEKIQRELDKPDAEGKKIQ